jgi:DNA-nicking Smr family endonuclease
MKRGRRALITEEDRQLWDQVRRSATPLRAEPPPEVVAVTPAAATPKAPAPPKARAAKAAPPTPPPKPRPPAPPPVGGFDRKTVTRLSRGTVAIDARIDLHGMTQDAAHGRLLRFLEAARADGGKIVLVITGKGAPANHGPGESGRGVLRRVVPEWLRSAAFGSLVSGYENAGRRHGGEGALYVRLRRKRSPGERN